MRKIIVFMLLMLIPITAQASCEEIPFDNQRNYCFALTTFDASYCERIIDNEYLKLYCMAKVYNDKSYCKKMENKANKRRCIKSFKISK